MIDRFMIRKFRVLGRVTGPLHEGGLTFERFLKESWIKHLPLIKKKHLLAVMQHVD